MILHIVYIALSLEKSNKPGSTEGGEVETESGHLDCCCWGQVCAHNSSNGSGRGLSDWGMTDRYSGLAHCSDQRHIPSYIDSLKACKQNQKPSSLRSLSSIYTKIYLIKDRKL